MAADGSRSSVRHPTGHDADEGCATRTARLTIEWMSRKLLFLPGVGADPAFWHPVARLLPSGWDKTFLGWPGLGHQPADPRVTSFDDLTAMAEQQLPEGGADVVAQSMGGAIALRLALRQPTKVRRLVLVATSGGIDVARLGAVDWRPEYRREYPQSAGWIFEPISNLTTELASISQPTLLIWGDSDPISPLSVGQTLASLLPNATLRLVPRGDHGLAQTHPAIVAEHIRRHLD